MLIEYVSDIIIKCGDFEHFNITLLFIIFS